MKNQIWIPNSKKMPLVRTVLMEKTAMHKRGFCLYLNGLQVFSNYSEQYTLTNIFVDKITYRRQGRIHLYSLAINLPLEVIRTDSKILWRLSKFVFRSQSYNDDINNLILINKF